VSEDQYQEVAEPRIDTTVPHPARRYNYWLGGKDNFAIDRQSGDMIAAAFPSVRIAALENRRFMRRAVSYLAREAGIRQFLDIGTGIPAADNTHEVAQAIAPDSRVVYVDNDPIVLAHSRALLTSASLGSNAYIEADLRRPREILNNPELLRTLDLSQPIGLMLVAILHFVLDDERPYELVRELVEAMPPGSYLTMTHFSADLLPPEVLARLGQVRQQIHTVGAMRTRDQFARFFAGLELVPPGVVPVTQWRADDEPEPRPAVQDVSIFSAIARIP
jgi:hypothetical protein